MKRKVRLLFLFLIAMCSCLAAFFAVGCDLLHKHDWDEWQIIKFATCSSMGEKTRICKSDPSHTETVAIEIDPEAHNYGAWEVTREPTCSVAGEKIRVCKRDSAHEEIQSIEIDPEAHDFGAWEVTREPTCAVAGERTRVCKRNQSHKETAAIEIDTKAHDWDEGKVTKQPTCNESGERVFTCLNDSKHTRKEKISPDPDAHVLGEWVEPVPSTCKENGVPGHYECKNCGTFFDEQKRVMKTTSLPLLEHDYITKEVQCGCEIGSYEIRLCKVCNDTGYRQTTKPKAHVGVNVCTGCGLNFMEAYKTYITSEGEYYESDSAKAYRITAHEIGNDGTYFQCQWWYQNDGTIKWMLYQLESIYSKTFDVEFDISWKANANTFDWEIMIYDTLTIMKGSLRPETLTASTSQSLPYTSVTGLFLSDKVKASLSKLACTSLQLLLALTDLHLAPPEGFSVVNYGFTKFAKPFMPHEYIVSSAVMDEKTHECQFEFSCSHCDATKAVGFDFDKGENALFAPATSVALHVPTPDREILFRERKFCLEGDFKRLYKRRR